MKYLNRQRRRIRQSPAARGEQGIALVISLLMGVILITAATGLLIRQLTAKKLSASESYQQLAETAASNGFNRILAVLNNASTSEYLGYLFTENNEPSTWDWSSVYSKGQYCSGTTGLPDYPDADGSSSTPWPASSVGYALNDQSIQGDGKGSVMSSYRLRSYTSTFSEGQGTGTFEVEGFVRRQNPEDKTDKILARARLTRSLQLKSTIARPEDWGVIAGKKSNLLENSSNHSIRIDGPGRFVWFTDTADTTLCNQTYSQVTGDSTQIVWPLLLDSNTPYIPAASTYNRDGSVDQIDVSGTNYNRVWSFDDTGTGLSCGGQQSIVCTRPGGAGSEIVPTLTFIQANTFGQTGAEESDTIEYKTFKRENWNFYIGICTDTINPKKNCRSEDIDSKSWKWIGPKGYWDGIPGSSITRWRTKGDGIQIGTCIKNNAWSCNMSYNSHWSWKDKEETIADSPATISGRNVIKIDSDDICRDNESSDVCHLYIEHLNLTNTNLYIKNDTRAIVLHLNIGGDVERRRDLENYTYNLGTNARICGVDSLKDEESSGQPACNLQPTQLVITQSGSSEKKSCPDTVDPEDFKFGGGSLPAAWVSMENGRIRPSDATLRGVIWASSICSSGNTTLITQNSADTAYVDQAKTYWEFPSTAGIGKRIVRGIRGSGFDIFKRW